MYSNLGFSSLGRLLENIVGVKVEDWVSKYITQPLGMSSTGYNFTQEVINRMAVGYNYGQLAPNTTTSCQWGNPSGGMYSTVNGFSEISITCKFFDSNFARYDTVLSFFLEIMLQLMTTLKYWTDKVLEKCFFLVLNELFSQHLMKIFSICE